MGSSRWYALLGIISAAANALFDILPEVLIGVAINTVEKQQNSFIGTYFNVASLSHQLLVLGVITALVFIFESLTDYVANRCWIHVCNTLQYALRTKGYNHLQKLSLKDIEQRRIGWLTSIINEDINKMSAFFQGGGMGGISAIIYIVSVFFFIGSMFLYVSPTIFFINLSVIPVVLAITFYYKKRMGKYQDEVREESARTNSLLTHNLMGISSIKSLVTGKYEEQRIAQQSNAYREASTKEGMVEAQFIPIVRLPIVCAFVCVLVYGGFQVLNGSLPVSVYTVIVFISQRFIWPFAFLGKTTEEYEDTMTSARRIFSLIDAPMHDAYGIEQSDITIDKKIKLNAITFGYSKRDPIFKDLSLTIPENDTVAFVGETGCGKSTIIKLLLRFYEPQSGTITFGDIKSSDLNPNTIRSNIGLVSQSHFIVPGTIAENIKYGSFNATDKEIFDAAKKAQLDEFISELPNGFNTVIDERGSSLSGGQKQRLMIARALVKNPPILIFDEATSAVDNKTEGNIITALRELQGKHTIILIAHRLNGVRHADCIYVIDEGEVIESGTHAELIKKNGEYAHSWNLQTGNV